MTSRIGIDSSPMIMGNVAAVCAECPFSSR
jgi:hypothetical protein